MPLHYIIDAYNIINHIRFSAIPEKTKAPQRALLDFINSRSLLKKSRNQITVVFDGYPKASGQKLGEADINVVFSQEETADARIKMMVETAKNPKNIVVVSDDKEIKFYIKSLRARSLGVEEFMLPLLMPRSSEKSHGQKEDLIKPELSYSQVHKINQELKAIWLKD